MIKPRRFTGYWILIPLTFLAHTLFYFFALGTDAVDDAYISFRYAQNAILGNGLFFNPGERVEGFTNFLWTTLMIPLEGAHVDVGRASMILGVLFGLATLWLVVRFAEIVNAPRGVGIIAALCLAVDGSFALWAVAGLETLLFAFLVFAGILLYINEQAESHAAGPGDANLPNPLERRRSTFASSGILFALAAMTRPEGLFVFAITVAHQAAWRIFAERRLVTRQDLTRVIAFGALFAPYWLGRWWYYKSFLPNSFYAKVSASGPAAQIGRGWNHLSQFVAVHMGWAITLPPIVAFWASWRRVIATARDPRADGTLRFAQSNSMLLFWTTYLLAIVVPYAAYIVYVGGDWSVGRFFVPLLAPFYMLFSTGIVEIWSWFGDRVSKVWKARATNAAIALCLALGMALFVFSSWNGEYGIYINGFDAANATLARETMGKWLRTHVPSGTLIAVDAAGQVPYFSELPAIDMFGINDLHIGRLNVPTLGEGTPGHEKFDLGYVIGRSPTYVVIYGTLLDTVKEYERAPVNWTNNQALIKFLTLYQKRGIP
jgi:arabinofuranosyltransferase